MAKLTAQNISFHIPQSHSTKNETNHTETE